MAYHEPPVYSYPICSTGKICAEQYWGRPLMSHEVVVNLIGHTTTNTGLTIQAELDKNAYPTGMKVRSEDMKRLNLSPAKFHGKDWNYAIKPCQQRS